MGVALMQTAAEDAVQSQFTVQVQLFLSGTAGCCMTHLQSCVNQSA